MAFFLYNVDICDKNNKTMWKYKFACKAVYTIAKERREKKNVCVILENISMFLLKFRWLGYIELGTLHRVH